MRGWAVVDETGCISPDLVRRYLLDLRGSMTQSELELYLVRACGFALVRAEAQRLTLRLKPDIIRGATFAGLSYCLVDLPWRRAIAQLLVDNTYQTHFLPTSPSGAIEKLSLLVSGYCSLHKEGILRADRSLLDAAVHPQLLRIVQMWQSHAAFQLPSGLVDVVNSDAQGHYFIAKTSSRGDRLIMHDVGPGFPAHVQAVLRPGMGRRLEDQPDSTYGRYCAAAYGQVAASGRPSFEDVDAVMSPAHGPPIRRRYSRIILPFVTGPSEQTLLGVSIENNAVDLRSSLAV